MRVHFELDFADVIRVDRWSFCLGRRGIEGPLVVWYQSKSDEACESVKLCDVTTDCAEVSELEGLPGALPEWNE